MATRAERFPKKYFNAKAVKEGPVVLTIEDERLEEITDPKTGKSNFKSVLSFEGVDTRLILNAVNFDLVCETTGEDDTADWPGHKIELFLDRTMVGGDRVDCVRVRPVGSTQPAPTLPKKKTTKPAPAPKSDEKPDFDDDIPFA